MSDQKDGKPYSGIQKVSKLSLDGFLLLCIPEVNFSLTPLTLRLCLTGGVETESPRQ